MRTFRNAKPLITLQTEGTYPFSLGGVSVWADMLCKDLENEVDFYIYAVTGNPNVTAQYVLSKNIKKVIHIPLWGAVEPAQYYKPEVPFSQKLSSYYETNDRIISKYFIPLFSDFLMMLFNPFKSAEIQGEILFGLWKFFQKYDIKKTLSSSRVWFVYKRKMLESYERYLEDKSIGLKSGEDLNQKAKIKYNGKPQIKPTVFNLIFNLRWLYHFLLPLAVPIPKVDVNHATITGSVALPSIISQYEYGTPSLVTDHGVFIRERLINISASDFSFYSKKLLIDLATIITRATYSIADQVSPVTSYNKKWEQYYGAKKDKIKVIPNGIDVNRFRPMRRKKTKGQRPTVVAAARVFPLKDVLTMIRSCNVARKEIPEIQYIVYGSLNADRHYVAQCLQLISELNLKGNFKFGGVHNNPPEIYNSGDISILSSISEGFPYSVIESMSCECPVVATDVGGVREALEGCGIICKVKDYEALGKAVIKLIKDDNLRHEYGRKGHQRVLEFYTKEKSVGSYLESYHELMNIKYAPLKYNLNSESVKNIVKHIDENAKRQRSVK